MIDKETALIDRLKFWVQSGMPPLSGYNWQRACINPPVTLEELDRAESILGFALPPLLKRIYLEVGNGGFGPSCLFKLADESRAYDFDAVVQNYLAMRSMTQEDIDTHWKEEEDKPTLWPEKVLMICDWGCNMYSYVDCASPEYRVLHTDSNISHSEFAIESPSLYRWLEDWLTGIRSFNWPQAEKITFSHLEEQ